MWDFNLLVQLAELADGRRGAAGRDGCRGAAGSRRDLAEDAAGGWRADPTDAPDRGEHAGEVGATSG